MHNRLLTLANHLVLSSTKGKYQREKACISKCRIKGIAGLNGQILFYFVYQVSTNKFSISALLATVAGNVIDSIPSVHSFMKYTLL